MWTFLHTKQTPKSELEQKLHLFVQSSESFITKYKIVMEDYDENEINSHWSFFSENLSKTLEQIERLNEALQVVQDEKIADERIKAQNIEKQNKETQKRTKVYIKAMSDWA